ncbi:MAG TPA: hypothetical protein VK000_02980 [Luteimonas sp.]|nr:hypothetical protein [Luteimonas sp.]
MRCSRQLAALLAVALSGASTAGGPGGTLLQPLGPGYEGCGCSVEAHDLERGRLQSQLLFQDLAEVPATTVRVDGAHLPLQPLDGELFVEWGAPLGTPVAASFAMPGGRVEFEGKVTRTCYGQESCEAVWYEGSLTAILGGRRESRPLSAGCGC